MAGKRKEDRIPELVTEARLVLAVKMKATTGERAIAFLGAAAAELLSLAGGTLKIAKHAERFETHLTQPEVKIGNALGDALMDGGPLFASSMVMRLARNMASSKEILSIDLKDFEHRED